MAGHNTIRMNLQSFIFMTVLQAIGNNFPILVPNKQINPIDYRECHDPNSILFLCFKDSI